MSASYNLSPESASAVAALLTKNLVPFKTEIVNGPAVSRLVDITVSNEDKAKLCDAIRLVSDARKEKIKTLPNTDSEEQESSYMNGTLSNVAPGLAITVQVSPSFTRDAMTQSEAEKAFPSMFLPLAVQGWDVLLILGDDIDNPIQA